MGLFSSFWGVSGHLGCFCSVVLGHFLVFGGISAWLVWGVCAWSFGGISLHFGVSLPSQFRLSPSTHFWGISAGFEEFLAGHFGVSVPSCFEAFPSISGQFGVFLPGLLGAFPCVLGCLAVMTLGCPYPPNLCSFFTFGAISSHTFQGISQPFWGISLHFAVAAPWPS